MDFTEEIFQWFKPRPPPKRERLVQRINQILLDWKVKQIETNLLIKSFQITHMYCEGNLYVEKLVNLGLELHDDSMVFNSCSDQMKEFYEKC